MSHSEQENTASMTKEDELVQEGLEQAEQAAQEEVPSYEELVAQISDLKGQLEDEKLRSLANEQNLRRRHQDELQSAHKFATQKFTTDMLTVKDYLEMALLDQSGQFDALKMGVTMTLNEMEKVFERGQVKEIAVNVGDKLDPHLHQALQTVDSDLEPNSIVSILKKGYQLADRVIRPAMVTVAKNQE